MSGKHQSVDRLNFIEFDPHLDTSGKGKPSGHNSNPTNQLNNRIRGVTQGFANKLTGIHSQVRTSTPDMKMLPSTDEPNLNSFGSIFNQDYKDMSGVDRVFKKSAIFLAIHLFFFLLISLTGFNWFNWSLLFNLFILISYISITMIFYIIVADRSYVWISTGSQLVIILLTNSIMGQGFSFATIIFAFLIIFFAFIAYSELEKVQLSSRLFSISHITSEASRILYTSAIILISLNIFNGIISLGYQNGEDLGSVPFVQDKVLENNFVMDYIIIGQVSNLSLNRVYMNNRFSVEGDKVINKTNNREARLANFLQYNYTAGDVVLSDIEEKAIRANCTGTTKECNDLVIKEFNQKLIDYQQKNYPDVNYPLDTVLNVDQFKDLTKQFYTLKLQNFENTSNSETGIIPAELLIVPLKSITPAVFAIVMFLFLLLIRLPLSGFIFLISWSLWKILVYIGYAKIDVETVEAEIVSI
jgi:hypothetical protein